MNRDAPRHYSIGWDVGAWHCDDNKLSKDAIAILDANRRLVGTPWRGNLRQTITESKDTAQFVGGLFALCGAREEQSATITLAIDAPLGFSRAFADLIAGRGLAEPGQDRVDNPYLFRETERHLFRLGHKPLSAVQDMIGSQTTKAMHALAKFAPSIERCGVWTDGAGFRAFETYPTVCRTDPVVREVVAASGEVTGDRQDALVCAVVAWMFNVRYNCLVAPGPSVPAEEGWIWYPAAGDKGDA